MTNAVAETMQHVPASVTDFGHFSRPESPVMGVGVKANLNIAIAKTANHFRGGEIPGRLGIGGRRLVSHSTTAQSSHPIQQYLASGTSANTTARETHRCNFGNTENRMCPPSS